MARIIYDGLNLALTRGTGVATYTRMLTRFARDLGHEVGVVYGTAQTPPKNRFLREVAFFDRPEATRASWARQCVNYITDAVRYSRPVAPARVSLEGVVDTREFANMLPEQDHIFAVRHLFVASRRHFARTGSFARLVFDTAPDILHCTYPLPLRVGPARNIYTIHDLVPFRLPFATLDNKRQMFRLLKKLVATADHVVTVSENSKKDIINLLGIDERRITNTYQAVYFPQNFLREPESSVAQVLEASFGLTFKDYLLFFGALEPKKNVSRLINAYLTSGVDIPLVLVAGEGWLNETETEFIAELGKRRRGADAVRVVGQSVQLLNYVALPLLVSLIRGARAVVFPSLYEGFGLPVLEAMVLGTPVITSRTSSLPEVAGEAALLVDPYSTEEISDAIRTISHDGDLRGELSRRGRVQAAKFSVERYSEQIERLYRSLL